MPRSSSAVRRSLVIATALLLLAPAAAPAAAPTHWWKADGDAVDVIAGANGTLSGDTLFAAGHDGQAFVFDGADDAVKVPSDAGFYPSGSFTLEGWARTTAASGPGQIATLYECSDFCAGGVTNSVFEIEIRDGKGFGYVRDTDAGGPSESGNGQSIIGGPLINDGAFHRVTLVRDMAVMRLALYVDGIEVAEDPLNGGADSALADNDGQPDPLTIGAQVEGGSTNLIEELTGAVDDVKLWAASAEYPDTTPPVIAAALSGPAGQGGWFTGDVGVSWSVNDESLQRSSSGCAASTVAADTAGVTLTCTSTSAGGTGSGSVTVKRDATAPTVTCPAAPAFGLGASGSITASVVDALSGAAAATASAAVTTAKAGSATVAVTGRDVAGNATTVQCPYTVVAPKPVEISTIAALPSPKACVSRRRFRITLRGVKKTGIVSAQIKLDKKVVRKVSGKGLTLPINLVGLPKGTFKVTITVTDARGVKRVAARKYRTCVPKGR